MKEFFKDFDPMRCDNHMNRKDAQRGDALQPRLSELDNSRTTRPDVNQVAARPLRGSLSS